MKNFLSPLWCSILSCALIFLSLTTSHAQPTDFSTATASSNGFVLKKTTTNTIVQSGVNFTYCIDFTIPAGAGPTSITDVLPQPLTFQAVTFTSPCGGTATPLPTVGTNGTVNLNIPATSTGCAGSICITVQFPNGTTCNGTQVRNQACIKGQANGVSTSLCTEFVTTTATAVNPWHITKNLLPNYTGPSCTNTVINDTARYQFCVYKDVGTTGQLNLLNGFVTDVLPAGATIIPSASTSCPYTVSTVGTGAAAVQTITWNIGALSALPFYNTYCCEFKVYYPNSLFPNGTTITNQATLKGDLGQQLTTQPPTYCGSFTQPSNTTSYQVQVLPRSTIYKWVNTTGQAGCGGRYTIFVCNNGAVTLNTFTITDALPATLGTYSLVGYGGNIAAPVIPAAGGTITVNSLAGGLPPGGSVSITIDFIIPIGTPAGTAITNCATLASPQLLASVTACTSFTVVAPVAKACVWKEVCSKQPTYLPGSTFRYRLRVQNIGGTAMTGTTVTDLLPAYLSLAPTPNMVYYTSNTWSVPSCVTSSASLPVGATAWTGVTYTGTSPNLTWTLPSIAAVCQNLFYTNCGLYGTGTVPYYYIEFDVKVNADAPIGNVPNKFTLTGGNLVTPETSNTDYVTIVGSAGYTLTKSIISPTSATVAPGSMVTYRLQFNNSAASTVALRHVVMADLLPRNNGLTDRRLLAPCVTNRFSTFDLAVPATPTVGAWLGNSGVPPIASTLTEGYETANNINVSLTNLTPPLVSGAYFASSCGTTFPWLTSPVNTPFIIAGRKNVGYYFGAQAVIPTNIARVDFKAQVSAAALANQTACNSFASNASKLFLFNSTILQDVAATEQESPNVCIKIDSVLHQPCNDTLKQPVINGTCCTYSATLQNLSGSPITQILWNASSGTIQNVTAAGCTNSVTVSSATTGNLAFSPACAANPLLSFDGTGGTGGLVAVTLSVIHANGDTCRLRFEYICKQTVNPRCDSMSSKPFVYADLTAIGKTFTFYNLSVPNSQICSIDIQLGTYVGAVFTELPAPKWLGGSLTTTGGTPTAGSTFVYPYTSAPMNTPSHTLNVSTYGTVTFNLGFDTTAFNKNLVYVRFVVRHCNGDSCSFGPIKWITPITPCPTCPVIGTAAVLDSVIAKQIALVGSGDSRPIKYVSFKIPTTSKSEIFAVSAESSDANANETRGLARLKAVSQGPKTALFEFETPVVLQLGQRSPLINMVFLKASPNLSYSLYDVDGNELSMRTIQITTGLRDAPTESTSGLKAKVYPNPAQNDAFVQYELQQSSDVKIDLFNVNGQFIQNLDNSRHDYGTYQTRFQTDGLAKGAYFVRIISNGFTKSLPLMVQ
jgi:uncharacterized repeat protein (TIGR01451 family)